jgi:predicted permease
MGSFFRKLAWLAGRRSREDQLAAELRFHLEEEAEEFRQAGLPEKEARSAALRDLGNLGRVQEETRAAWGWTLVEQLAQDLRYAARTIRRNPAFTLLATLSLALGIGANTAIYSFMDALLARALPVADPRSLAVLNWHVMGGEGVRAPVVHDASGFSYHDPKNGRISPIFPYPAFELLRKSNDICSVLFAYRPARKLNLFARNQAEVADGEYVSGDYFRGLAVTPASGRLITGDDDRADAPAVVVLSYGFAETRFGDAARAVGQPVTIGNIPFTVIGVTPPGFFGVDPAKAPRFYLPLHADLLIDPERGPGLNPAGRYFDQHYYWIEMMARLKPGVTIARAQAALAPVFAGWVAATAANDQERRNLPEVLLKEGSGGLDNLRREYSQPFLVLLAIVGLILAIACANIASLLLARATARRREMSIRLSVGAGRWRVIRQLLTESLLLAAIGGAAGVLFAVWGIQLLTLLLSAGADHFILRAELNWHVLLAAAALTMVTGILFGLAPALQATRVDLKPLTRRRLRLNLRQVLVASQIAIALLLLVAAGLFVRTVANLNSLETGFHRDHLLVFKLNAWQAGHREPEILSFYRDLETRFAAIPGVRAAVVANSPLIGDGAFGWPVVPSGLQPPDDAPSGHGSGMAATSTRVLEAGPGFFAAMQISILAGREFDARDQQGSLPVAIVNQAWARLHLGGRNPIGHRIVSFWRPRQPVEMEIVGVAKNARYDDLTGPFPAVVYMPFEQNLGIPIEEATFLLRTAADPLAFANTVREIVRQADPRIPVTSLGTQTAQIEGEMSQQILFARLCTGFSILALAIACVGLYGTMSYTVARRTPEIGIRMALGAQRSTVVWMVLREVLILALAGLAIAVPGALAASKLVASFLFDVKPNDPASFAAAIAILLTASLLAGFLPARNASRIDPLTAVRHE